MSAVHASVPMVDTSGGVLLGDPPNLSALGKALGQTVISSPSGSASHELGVSTAASTTTPSNSTRKSPKKRERTDSMKTMTPAPAAQRAKSDGAAFDNGDGDDDDDDDGEGDDDDDEDGDDDDADDGHAGEEEYSDTSSTAADGSGIKLPVKDRTGSAIAGVSRVALISNAVKTAPPAKEKSNPRRWSKLEDESLRLAVERSGERNWKAIAEQVPGRNHTQCLQRWTKVLKPGLIKGHWDPEEDIKLRDLVSEGKRNWGQVASLIPGRTSKQCRERWCNHLDPNINKGMYTEEEDRIIMEMQAKLGNRWSIIAQHLKGRTEDAVKIRWKSLMRGKKAAGKEAQQAQASATASAASLATTTTTTATDTNSLSVAVGATTKASDDKTRVKAARTPTRQKTRAASPVDKPLEPIAFKSDPTVPPAPQPIYLPPGGGSADNSSTSTTLDSKQVAASINSYVQNVNDLVAASIQNYRLGQNFSPALPTTTNVGSIPTSTAPVTSNSMLGPGHAAMMSQSTITSMNQPVYTMAASQGYPGMPLSQSQRQFFGMQPNMNLPPNYVLPTTSTGQPFPVAMPSSNGAMHPVSITGYGQYGQAMMSDGRAMGMPPGYGPGGVPIGPQVGISYVNGSVPMGAPAYAMAPVAGVPPTHPSIGGHGEPLAPVSASAIPAHVMSSQSSRLATPREEWGSSQTPRSHLIMEEGHASAYELFHQQRLRLMLKEREKGMSLTSAPSPGQAMLTKELKANKERQKRQEMMQKGWKTAVEAMMLNNDTPSLDDSDIMEKVGLSALDPTDDELMDSGVEITLAADDTIVDGDETPLLVDQD